MRKVMIILVLIIQVNGYSQNAQDLIDKLKVELKTKPDAKRTATIYSDLTWYYSNISPDSSLIYGKKALFESNILKDSVLTAQVYSDLGAVYFRKTDYKSSKESFLKAYQIRKSRNDKIGMAKIAANLANIYSKENNKVKALKSYLESLDFFEKTNNFEAASLTNANIGSLFLAMKDYKKSRNYTQKAIDYQELKDQQAGLATSYLTMGNINLLLKDTITSLKFYEKSIRSAKKAGNNFVLASAMNNISNIKISQNKNEEASKLIEKSNQIASKFNTKFDDSGLLLNKAANNISKKNYIEAKIILNNLKKIYQKNNIVNSRLNQTYSLLSIVHSYLNAPDSTNYYIQTSLSLQDQIIENSVLKQTAELETKYQTAKKEKLLIQKEAEAKKRNQLVLGLALFSVLIGFIGFLIYRQQKLKNQQQSQAFELKQAINQIETQNKLQNQRLAISKDLHDNIGAQLTFIISSVETAKFAPEIENTKLGNKLTKISDFTKDTIVELRDTIWAMNSNEISFEDLQIRISNFIEKASGASENIAFNFNIDKNLNAIKLTSIIGMNIYRTIQEAINNALKYSKADKIAVNICKINDKINIEITDNGIGFDKETIVMGNGLENMQKRIEEINGTFKIESENGTKILIVFNV